MTKYACIEQIVEHNRDVGLDVDYMQTGQGTYAGRFLEGEYSASTFVFESASVPIMIEGQVDRGIYYVIGGNDGLIHLGKKGDWRELIIYPPGSEFYMATRSACSAAQMMMPRDIVDAYLDATDPSVTMESRRSPIRTQLSPDDAARFRSTVWGLARTEDASVSRAQDIESLILSLLVGENDPGSEPGKAAADCRRMFEAAKTYILDNLKSAISIFDVCIATNIPQRTLNRVFQRNTGLSPKQFLHVCRLNAVRRELLAGTYPGVSVADTARRYQFNHLGRFSSTYKGFFRELPRASLARK